VHVVIDRQEDAGNSDERSKLQHRPCRPVERHQVFSVAELEGHQDVHPHDDSGEGNDKVEKGTGTCTYLSSSCTPWYQARGSLCFHDHLDPRQHCGQKREDGDVARQTYYTCKMM
jgi:hypothetical protein